MKFDIQLNKFWTMKLKKNIFKKKKEKQANQVNLMNLN